MERYLKKVRSSPRTPTGYRLATVQDITNNLDEISSRGVINYSENCRVLDGIVCARGEFPFPQNPESEAWPLMPNMLIITQPPHLSGKGSALLRKDLYAEVTIDERRRKIALNLAFNCRDIEVIYWLQKPSSDLAGLIQCFDEKDALQSYPPNFSIICKMLIDTTLNIGEYELNSSFDYAWWWVKRDRDYAISVVEMVLEVCPEQRKMDLVDAQIQRTFESSSTGAEYVGILAKLLSVSTPLLESRTEIIKDVFQKLFTEACRRGYASLVADLLELPDAIKGKIEDEVDDGKKTLLHYAAEWEREDTADKVFWALFDQLETPDGDQMKLDLDERSVLHFASLGGRAEICKKLLSESKCDPKMKDKRKENILHYAARAKNGSNIVDALDGNDKLLMKDLVCSKNDKGETPLHTVAIYGNTKMFHSLRSHEIDLNLKETDNAGRTPLHMAASEGHLDLVGALLRYGSDPLQERDMSGRTALHFAVTNTKGKETAKALAEELLDNKPKEKKALLLWVSASGIGTAEETRGIDKDVKDYLIAQRKETHGIKLLLEAAKVDDARLAWEFLIRGGKTREIRQMPHRIRKQIETYMEQGMERPTLVDTLGRDALAECIAEHFLNSHIKSPINVSISGGSGMGKTSLMQQIKAYLQLTSAQLTIPYLWKYEELSGKKINLSKAGKTMLRQIEKGVAELVYKKQDFGYGLKIKENALVQFLEKYRAEHEAVYKSLACMDFGQLLHTDENDSLYRIQGQSLGAAPRVLTVDFNAGMYRGNYEAWAGLVLEITQAIEDSMTWAQRFSTRWRNARRKHNISFFFKFILPGFLVTFLALWVAWAAWLLLDRTSIEGLEDLKYGSIPATIIAIVWTVVNSATSIFKSVSSQMSEYFTVSDYQFSYQQTVISDIKFLKTEIGKKPFKIFSFLAGEMCKNWFGLRKNYIENTSVPKYGSAPEGKLQIIAFVDDLDHCENEAVSKVLWSINLVFRACDINFILAVDKTTIQKAFRDSDGTKGEDFVDDFISKTIQLPVNLPDPQDSEWKVFLEEQLGFDPGSSEHTEKDGEIPIRNFVQENTASTFPAHTEEEDPDDKYDTTKQDKDQELKQVSGYEGCFPLLYRKQRQQAKGNPQDIEHGSNQPGNQKCLPCLYGQVKQCAKGISSFFQKILSWVQWFVYILYVVACNDRPETEPWDDDSHLWNSKVLSTRMLEVRGSLMLTYSKDEKDAFVKLIEFARGIQKFPREWKCYIKYHKFARNVILKKAKKYKKGFSHPWQAEFVVWTFVCMQWKREMNILIKHWDKLTKENTETKHEESSSKMPSLKDVVANYQKQRWPENEVWVTLMEEAFNKIQSISKNAELDIKCRLKRVDCFEEVELKCETMKNKVDADRGEEERERWNNLHKCLDEVHDVTMEGIRIFQQFRFHCDAKNLIRQ